MRVHEPLSVLDLLDADRGDALVAAATRSLPHIARARAAASPCCSIAARTPTQLLRAVRRHARARAQAPERGRMDLRTYGIGAQILRELRRARA